MLGRPVVQLRISTSASVIGFCASLAEVGPDGASHLVAKGILSVTRRGSARDTPADGRDPARASARGRIEMRRQRPNMEIAADAPHLHRHWIESIPRSLLSPQRAGWTLRLRDPPARYYLMTR